MGERLKGKVAIITGAGSIAPGMGIGKEELEEAAALATAFAGCRALMLWNQMKRELL